MGWMYCGTDENGRNIGYGVSATCDATDCKAKIDRGLAYVCGNMHGGDGIGCGKYFCTSHLICAEMKDGSNNQLCAECYKINEREGCLADDT